MANLTPKAKQIYLYDYYEKLRNNLNRIKQLQLFSIDKYTVDYTGNQWFLYKPKWNRFKTTNNSQQIYNFTTNKPGREEVDLKSIKASEDLITNFKTTPGELWVRLKNFPMAYPISYNAVAKINQTIWYKALAGEIYKFDIFENFGYILYKANNQYSIMVFNVESDYDDQIYILNSSTRYTEVLDHDVYYNYDTGETAGEVTTINRRILITPLKTFNFPTSDTIIDVISHSGAFYVFYYDYNDLVTSQTISITKIDQTKSALLEKTITPTSTVTLPQYTVINTNVCQSLADGNWTISVSADNVNIAYESVPLD